MGIFSGLTGGDGFFGSVIEGIDFEDLGRQAGTQINRLGSDLLPVWTGELLGTQSEDQLEVSTFNRVSAGNTVQQATASPIARPAGFLTGDNVDNSRKFSLIENISTSAIVIMVGAALAVAVVVANRG